MNSQHSGLKMTFISATLYFALMIAFTYYVWFSMTSSPPPAYFTLNTRLPLARFDCRFDD